MNNYQGFEEFIKSENIEKLENLEFGDNKSNDIFKILEENSKNEFEEKITEDKINNPRKNFDDFYRAAYQLILSKLNNENFEDETLILIFMKMFVNHYLKTKILTKMIIN